MKVNCNLNILQILDLFLCHFRTNESCLERQTTKGAPSTAEGTPKKVVVRIYRMLPVTLQDRF